MASPFVETVFPIGHGEPVQFVTPVAYTHVAATANFWNVTNRTDGSPIYSSADAEYMPDTDSRYTDWVALGNIATVIATDGQLADVLAKAGVTGPAVLNTNPTDWTGVAAVDIVGAMQAAGVKLTDSSNDSVSAHYQLTGPYETMARTQIYVNANNQLPNNIPLNWPAYDKTVTFANAQAFEATYRGLQDYYAAWENYAASGGNIPTWGTKTIA